MFTILEEELSFYYIPLTVTYLVPLCNESNPTEPIFFPTQDETRFEYIMRVP